jgi:SET family sugar efflux transporter-like MFS transporter
VPAATSISARKRLGDALLAGYPLVLARPEFRALFLVLMLGGTASGMSMAYLSVWASDTFGVGPQSVALLFVVSGVVGAAVNPLLGMLSDRFGWRRRLIVGQLAVMSLAYIGYTQAMDFTTAMVLVAFSGFGIIGLALAMVNDLINVMPEMEKRNAMRIVSVERTAWSIGIIIGPAVAAAIVTAFGGTRPVFAAAAITQVVAIGVVSTVRARASVRPRVRGASPAARASSSLPSKRTAAMVAAFIALVLVALPTQARNMYLPLFVSSLLHEPPGMVGPCFSLTAMIAVVAMPYVGTAADRFGTQRVLYLGALVGAAYCGLQSISGTYLQTLAIQLLVGLGLALWSTSTLIYLQQLMPGRAGVAGGLYVSTIQLTPVLGGLLLGPIAETAGIPAAFAATAILSLVSLVLLVRSHRALARQ